MLDNIAFWFSVCFLLFTLLMVIFADPSTFLQGAPQ